MKEISKEVVKYFSRKKEFNALSIQFYNNPEYIGEGNAMGYVNFAPYGKWGRADEVETGEVSKMDYDYNLN